MKFSFLIISLELLLLIPKRGSLDKRIFIVNKVIKISRVQKRGLIWGIKALNLNLDIIKFLKLRLYRDLILLINSFGEVTKVKMGIKEWFVPQISEHCPV